MFLSVYLYTCIIHLIHCLFSHGLMNLGSATYKLKLSSKNSYYGNGYASDQTKKIWDVELLLGLIHHAVT